MKTQRIFKKPFFHTATDKVRKRAHKILLLCALFVCTACFSGCTKTAQEPISATSFKLNTVVQIQIYDSRDESLLDECMKLCDKYEAVFSRTDKESELYKLNHRELPPVKGRTDTCEVSEPLAELITKGLSYAEQSKGAFDITIAPVSSLWDFTAENPELPDEAALSRAVSACGYKNIAINGREITFSSPETAFDLGAIAKGYIADRIKEYLVSRGVKSAVINLGGNVLCIGTKPGGTPFKIGIQKPFADRNETIAVMDITGRSVVSSGIYERCFEKDGRLYHHILNPATGYPCVNDLVAVTIISDASVDGDALSTVCFALGFEKGLEYANSLENVQAFFVTSDYEVHYTDSFQEEITVTQTES